MYSSCALRGMCKLLTQCVSCCVWVCVCVYRQAHSTHTHKLTFYVFMSRNICSGLYRVVYSLLARVMPRNLHVVFRAPILCVGGMNAILNQIVMFTPI